MEKAGWLTKTNKRNKKQQRYYVLDKDNKTLTYFKKPLGESLGVIDLKNSEIKNLEGSTFNILTTVSKLPKKFKITAENPQGATEWFNEIKETIENKDFENKGEKLGWMIKKGKNRWFLLKNGIIYWFLKEQPPSSDFRKFIKGSIQLDGCSCSPVSTKNLMISTTSKSYTLTCSETSERDSWVEAIRFQFNSIKQQTNDSLQKSGWLEKKGQKRFFIMKDLILKWYTSESDTGSERGSVILSEYMVTTANEPSEFSFSIVSNTDPSKRYRLIAKSRQDAEDWVVSLKKSMKIVMENKRKSTIQRRQTIKVENNKVEEKMDLVKKGWLAKKGKSRYFVLNNEVMMYFVSDDPSNSVVNMKGSINLIGCTVSQEHYSFIIKTKRGVVFKLTATSQPEVMEWIEHVREASKGKGEKENSSIAGTLVPLRKTGWVSKKGKKRFLLLRTGDLLYFEKEQNDEVFSEKPKGVILLAGCTVNEVGNNSFLVRSADDNSWIFICNTASEAKSWLDHLLVFIVRANDALASGLEKSGYLLKKGKQRWFALKKGVLLWYNSVQQQDFISTETANGNLILFGCTVKQSTSKKLSFTIVPPGTGKKVYELISPSEQEMNDWITCISNAAKKNPVRSSSGKIGEVFGQPLSKVLEHDKTEIPIIVTKALSFIESKGLESPGIFRLSGNLEVVKEIKEAYDKHNYIEFDTVEASLDDITGLLKLFIRELPEPVTTYELYTPLLENKENPEAIKELLGSLPKENYSFIKVLVEFLGKVVSFEEVNHMSTSNIAIVVGPNLLRPKETNMLTSLADTPNILAFTRTLIEKRDLIFV